ncbi:MAG: hypothetical protein ABIT36_07565 [Steroidobacteraceae bacterium]
MRKAGFLAFVLAAALAGCGGGDDKNDAFQGDGTTGGTTGGTGTGGATSNAQLGSGTGAAFATGVIGLSSATVSAGGSTSLSVALVQTDGNLYTQSTAITFNSPCVAAGTAVIQPSATATTTTGAATVTYVARGCAGTDVVTATATVNGVTRTATGTVTVAVAAIGSIAFVSATPTNIALKGTGDTSRPESSIVVFKVLDASGGPRAGAAVSFTLNTNVGGITLQPAAATATSDAQGNAQIVVNAGTVSTSVKVTAAVTSVTPAISTQSSQLTITTGIPTAGSFSLAVGCFNVEGWDIDGTTTLVTARLADRFGNPAPDGTAVTFTTEGGAIISQCTTTTVPAEGGVCSVNWRSSNPRPVDGRVTLLAKAIGEESFTDANGNGAFDNGEAWADLGEPYRDDNESGAYEPGTDADFVDFNNNGTRNVADGLFNGVLCNDTAGRCGNAASRSTGIGQQNLVILSGSTPVVTQTSGAALAPVAMGLNTSSTITLWVRDARGNPMPGGSDVTGTIAGGGLALGAPTAFKIPCSKTAAGTQVSGVTVYSFTVISGTTAGSGVFTLTVKTPSGLETIVQVGVTAS